MKIEDNKMKDLGDVKLKDLGKATTESFKEMGEELLDKTEDKVHEMKEKMVEKN